MSSSKADTTAVSSLSQSDKERLTSIKERLQPRVTLEPGLAEHELKLIQQLYGFRFPPDLEYFLRLCLPISPRFPNWRGDRGLLEEQLRWPFNGIAFDIKHSAYWRPEWRGRPTDDDQAVSLAMEEYRSVPKLIPVYAHCYLPAEPCIVGNPVFSVYQTDVIHRGGSLADYLAWLCYEGDKDEIEGLYPVYSPSYRYIRFWSDLARENYE